MTVLVTGGAGYIGSHACLLLLEAGFDVVVVDNLATSSRESLDRVALLTGKKPEFVELDLLDQEGLQQVFDTHEFEAVIHFAGLKAVGESVEKPELYFRNNVEGSKVLLSVMETSGVRDIIFSSSATVYGEPENVPVRESAATGPTNPYGDTKLAVENLLKERAGSSQLRALCLRYFNPVGAHESGRIGEDPKGTPDNLLPYIARVAVGQLPEVKVFGDDYPTIDGTGVRDYIHVMDLVEGHLQALRWLQKQGGQTGLFEIFNLGTGTGYSVLEMIRAFEEAAACKIPYQIVERRVGDVAESYADVTKATSVLDWQTKRGLQDMMKDVWRWQIQNPEGYGED